MDCSPPGSSVHGHFISPGELPNPGCRPASPAFQAGSLPLSHGESPHVYLAIAFSLCLPEFLPFLAYESFSFSGLWIFSINRPVFLSFAHMFLYFFL